mmetsp:Transcript_15551/g.26895  ORF Transcript_15551/g.26895 Transcript_15551/m.26895 type:complete len:505 (+) Transcript_15551:267-1781(+)
MTGLGTTMRLTMHLTPSLSRPQLGRGNGRSRCSTLHPLYCTKDEAQNAWAGLGEHASPPASTSSQQGSAPSPLELLRTTQEPIARARLLQQLDGVVAWRAASTAYRPTEIETLLSTQLGVGQDAVMQLALGKPELVLNCTVDQAQASIKHLKAANIDVQDIWFIVSKRPVLLTFEVTLQRWLDFLSVYGLSPSNLQNFLISAPVELFHSVTLFQAGQVVQFLRSLGMRNEFLAQRVLSVWPEVLARDVDSLRPVIQLMMQLGIEVADVNLIVCSWPEILLTKEADLNEWCAYLKGIGCTSSALRELVMQCPHLLGFSAQEVFGSRVQCLVERLGVRDPGDLPGMLAITTRWLSSPGGVQSQVDVLLSAGFSVQEARDIVIKAPGTLAEKDFDLQRKLQWITGDLGLTLQDIIECPAVMAMSFMQVVGPRHAFLIKQGKPGKLQLQNLVQPTDDVDWCSAVGVSAIDYARYRAHFEEEYTQGLTQSAAQEFQDELRKLGIYEGSD